MPPGEHLKGSTVAKRLAVGAALGVIGFGIGNSVHNDSSDKKFDSLRQANSRISDAEQIFDQTRTKLRRDESVLSFHVSRNTNPNIAPAEPRDLKIFQDQGKLLDAYLSLTDALKSGPDVMSPVVQLALDRAFDMESSEHHQSELIVHRFPEQ